MVSSKTRRVMIYIGGVLLVVTFILLELWSMDSVELTGTITAKQYKDAVPEHTKSETYLIGKGLGTRTVTVPAEPKRYYLVIDGKQIEVSWATFFEYDKGDTLTITYNRSTKQELVTEE